jgi:NAD-dependent SIR2 family protein deacetylase
MTKVIPKIKSRSAILLGAGASAAEGVPVQTHLFRDYFKLIKTRRRALPEHERELATFFMLMFDIDVDHDDLDAAKFPTFEEAPGILDLADLRNESFKEISNINFATNSGQIKFSRLYLVFLMTDIINERLLTGKGIHKQLVDNLHKLGIIDQTAFITTNYDILCDNALMDLWPGKKIEYGTEFSNYSDGSFERPGPNSIKFFKLHGSLNWLYCPTCNKLKITPYEKGVYKIMVDPRQSFCETCETNYSPIIVPPTFYKNLSNVFLGEVWNRAESALLQVDHLVFCGYSFPDADIHIKYLLKRIQKNRPAGKPVKFTVINSFIGKNAATKQDEKGGFTRFLGNGVNYTEMSFEEFSANPKLILKM